MCTILLQSETLPAEKRSCKDSQAAFCRSADGRVAGHIRNFIQIKCKDTCLYTKPCGGQSGFNSCVPCADYRNVIFSCKIFFHKINLFFIKTVVGAVLRDRPKSGAHIGAPLHKINYLPTQNFSNTFSITASLAFSPVSS